MHIQKDNGASITYQTTIEWHKNSLSDKQRQTHLENNGASKTNENTDTSKMHRIHRKTKKHVQTVPENSGASKTNETHKRIQKKFP